ncbi:hypothetical protein H4582DRAFT_1973044, partial [Lactarius indigo]
MRLYPNITCTASALIGLILSIRIPLSWEDYWLTLKFVVFIATRAEQVCNVTSTGLAGAPGAGHDYRHNRAVVAGCPPADI